MITVQLCDVCAPLLQDRSLVTHQQIRLRLCKNCNVRYTIAFAKSGRYTAASTSSPGTSPVSGRQVKTYYADEIMSNFFGKRRK